MGIVLDNIRQAALLAKAADDARANNKCCDEACEAKSVTEKVTAEAAMKDGFAELIQTVLESFIGVNDPKDMDAAIRLSVAPVIGDAELTVRFNVPRERITDASAHAIIRIVRELASNAVRHGGARKVKVAGSADTGVLMFSVTDDGCGFAVDQAPGIDECHFGLQGIRERVARFQGKMDIESTLGKGTKVVIKLKS